MPRLLKRLDGGWYVRSAVDRQPVTYQLTDEGLRYLLDAGCREGEELEKDLLFVLIDNHWVYTGGSGPGEELPNEHWAPGPDAVSGEHCPADLLRVCDELLEVIDKNFSGGPCPQCGGCEAILHALPSDDLVEIECTACGSHSHFTRDPGADVRRLRPLYERFRKSRLLGEFELSGQRVRALGQLAPVSGLAKFTSAVGAV